MGSLLLRDAGRDPWSKLLKLPDQASSRVGFGTDPTIPDDSASVLRGEGTLCFWTF